MRMILAWGEHGSEGSNLIIGGTTIQAVTVLFEEGMSAIRGRFEVS